MIKYSKAIALILCLIGFLPLVRATEQFPDYIEYEGKKYRLDVNWGHPSPLQVLYIRTNTQSPFKFYSTANYRGHIATWRISEGKLYLVNVDTRRHYNYTGVYWPEEGKRLDTLAAPGYFKITSLSEQPALEDGAVLADWFSGVLEIGSEVTDKEESEESDGVRYIYIRYGEVIDDQLVFNKDFERMNTITEKDTSDHAFMDKFYITYLNQCYISFYFQSGMARDKVTYEGHKGRFDQLEFRPILMTLFNNDPMQYPFNWENFQHNGTPVCTWSISHDSLFINSITLWSGLGFFQHDEDPIPLDELFKPERLVNGRVFAFWMNGEQTIEYGEERKDEWGMDEFILERQQHIVLDSGRIVQSSWIPSDFSTASLDVNFETCKPKHQYRCVGASERYSELPIATTLPYWTEGDNSLQTWFDNHPLTDSRATNQIISNIVLLFKVNCQGEAGEWSIASKGKGELFEIACQVLDIAKQLPRNGWTPATNKKGNAVDCWQVMTFLFNNGKLQCSVEK